MMFQDRMTFLYDWIKRKLDITVIGLENISRDKNYIFVMNHQSIADIPIAFSVLIPQINRKLNLYMSNRFYNFFFWLAAPLEVMSIKMNKKSKRAREYNRKQIEKGVEKLREGNCALIYPEGIIFGGLKGNIIKAGTGAVRLAIKSRTPIIPIGIRGSNKAYPFLLDTRNPLVIKASEPIHIVVGEEINLRKYAKANLDEYSEKNKLLLRRLTNELMSNLSKLSGLPMDEEVYKGN